MRRNIYRTAGAKEPAPWGLFDDEFHLRTASGHEFQIWCEEFSHLLCALYKFHWERQLIARELPLVSQWNECKGVFDWKGDSSNLCEVADFVAAIKILRDWYTDYEADGKTDGYAALSKCDLDALITFLERADSNNERILVVEEI